MDERTLESLRSYAQQHGVIITITIDNVGNVTTNLVDPQVLGHAIDSESRRRTRSWLRDTQSGSRSSDGYRT